MAIHNLQHHRMLLFFIGASVTLNFLLLTERKNATVETTLTGEDLAVNKSNSHLDVDSKCIQLQQWANSITALKNEDDLRTKLLFEDLVGLDNIRDRFYQIISEPLQTACSVGKFFGGQWLGKCGSLDGHKYVCLDKLYQDIQTGNCLIYSFGVDSDWSFEESMAEMGCKVRSFDPTTDEASKPAHNLISFRKIGLGAKNETIPGIGQVVTLQDSMLMMKDLGKTISYLKVDIEGSELNTFPEWISSGVLDHVSQIGIEIHTSQTHIGFVRMKKSLVGLIQVIRDLNKLGFRLISSTNNGCMGKDIDYSRKYYTLMEVVFYKV